MNVPVNSRSIDIPTEFQSCFDKQRAAYLAAPEPSYAQRIADLKSLTRLLKDNKDELVAAINADYGNRSEFETLFAEYFVVLETVADAVKHLKKWMKPQRRHVDFMTYPLARNRVIPQPLGVVGVIVPWNFPLNLSFCPLAAILAAGNRAMVKMSENSKALAKVLMRVSPKYFPIEKLAFFEDGGGRGPGFSSLPFDHLLFTGSGATGRSVMANAARNLTPVTLELGGKAPAIVGPDFPVKTAAERILWVKMFNAGQICTNVDYMFLPKGSEDEFVRHCRRLFAERFPDINGQDYTSIIDERSFTRLQATLEDARTKGAVLVNLAEQQIPDAERRKFAPHLVLNPTEDMIVMRARSLARSCRSRRMQIGRRSPTISIVTTARWQSIHSLTMPSCATSTSRGSCRVAYRSMKLSCTSASTTCLSVGSGRAAWAITTRARGSTPFQNCARSSTRALSRRSKCYFSRPTPAAQ
jgi:coniferyl-aldehyde dehydrogenase